MGKKDRRNAPPSDSEEEVCMTLIEDGSPTYEFYECLVELHARFDVNEDGVLCDTELRTFSRAAHADHHEFSDVELEKIREYFEWEAGLTLQGFLQMYVGQAANDEAGTWEELSRFGYTNQLELAQLCENAKFVMTRNAALQVRLEEFLLLALTGDVQALVSALSPESLAVDEQHGYVERLQSDSDSQLPSLADELKCTVSGRDVVDIEGDQEQGPVTFNLWSDSSLSFACDNGRWCAAELSSLIRVVAAPDPVCPATLPQHQRNKKGYQPTCPPKAKK
jgi:hypothetical protein